MQPSQRDKASGFGYNCGEAIESAIQLEMTLKNVGIQIGVLDRTLTRRKEELAKTIEERAIIAAELERMEMEVGEGQKEDEMEGARGTGDGAVNYDGMFSWTNELRATVVEKKFRERLVERFGETALEGFER